MIALLVLTTGTHWIALQTIAWTTMLAANLTTSSFSQAVNDTFDGEHPCCLCKAVKAGRQTEKESKAAALVLKMEFPEMTEAIALVPPALFELLPQPEYFAEALFSRPPLPPPRSFLA